MDAAAPLPLQQQQQQAQQDVLLEDRPSVGGSLKRPAATADQQPPDTAGPDTTALDAGTAAQNSSKRRRGPDAAAAADPGVAAAADNSNSSSLPGPPHPHPHQDRSHLRKHHTLTEDADQAEGQQADQPGGSEQQQQQLEQQLEPEQGQPGARPHKHKRSSKQANRQLLSFEGEGDDGDGGEQEAGAAAAAVGTAAAAAERQPHVGGMGEATAAKFKAEARQAAAARFTFQPSSSSNPSAAAAASGGDSALARQQPGLGLVDEDDCVLRHAAPAGLSQIHFGVAQARGARPYMEDRHCVVTALKPSKAAAAAAPTGDGSGSGTGADGPCNGSSAAAAPAADGLQSPHIHRQQQQQQHPAAAGVMHDGVARCYAAIFDGHNGAGAAETAARQLHVLLAGHPALRIYKGDSGPPAVVKQEEAAVGKALKAAFRQVDDQVLAVARRDGTRDGATALVVLRLGGALYAAHAGDSRAVLCREGLAHRLTEDHKPDLPQERQRIEDAGGRVDFQRCWRVVVEPTDGRPGSGLAVSRSLGDLDFKEPARFVECDPDVTRLALQPHKDSFVVLGSDGLWDVLSDYDAVLTAAAALKAYSQEHQRSSSHQQASGAAVTAATQLYKQHGQQQQQFSLLWQGHSGSTLAGPQAKAELPAGVVYSDGAATAAAEALLAESMRRGTMDNVTVIVMLLQWE